MKHVPVSLMLAAILAAPAAFAEKDKNTEGEAVATESNDTAVRDLCSTYAEEDKITADKLEAYIRDCMGSMMDLSEGMQESLPLTAGESEEPAAAPMSETVNDNPEQMVKSELVETPDPAAEQLDAGKN